MNQEVNGKLYFVGKVIRKAGYRTQVHYHKHTVTSCVLKGETTIMLEGYPNRTFKAGQCYVMPANIKGANVNTGKTTLQLLDIISVPSGDPFMNTLENEKGESLVKETNDKHL